MRTPVLGTGLVDRDRTAELPAWARRFGITRLARVTGLDRIGLEVACAIRPAGQLLQVSNGKGRTFEHAARSALSEAVELHASEHPDPARLLLRRDDFSGNYWGSGFLLGEPGPLRDASAVSVWVEGERLDRPGRAFIPASHVYCPAEPDVPVGLRTIGFTANGIGAHPDREQARLHGLLEMLEREALCRTMADGWMPEHLETKGIRFESALVDRLRSLGMTVRVVDATPDRWPVPVVAALIVDPESRAAPLAAGYACRPTIEAAAEAALDEACQSRLTEIHGAREDVAQAVLEIPEWLLESHRPARVRRFSGSKGIPGILKALGVPATAVDLTPAASPLHVTRVFVPGFRLSELLL